MKAEWRTFLQENGAEFDGDRVVSYGSPRRELSMALTGNVFADLSHRALVAVHGKDAAEFLQNQLSNDVREVSESRSQLTSYCSPKGRMLAIFRLFRRGDEFYLSLPEELVEAVVQRLRMFVLRSDVTLEIVTDTFVHLGVSGPDAEDELDSLLGEVPKSVDDVLRSDDCTVIRVAGIHPRFEIYGPLDCAKRLWQGLNVRCAPVGEPAWGLLEVMAGIPVVHAETVEAFVPQMANLQLVGGVSFKKGCYPGQEVVARMQYLGKLKRRMYLVRIADEPPAAPGTDIFSAADPEQSAGQIVEARPHPDGGQVALAVIRIAAADKGDLHLGLADGPLLEFLDLPYPVAEATAGE